MAEPTRPPQRTIVSTISSTSGSTTPARNIIRGLPIGLANYMSQCKALGFACDELVAECTGPCFSSYILVPSSRMRHKSRDLCRC